MEQVVAEATRANMQLVLVDQVERVVGVTVHVALVVQQLELAQVVEADH
jgi:hypothetical protein